MEIISAQQLGKSAIESHSHESSLVLSPSYANVTQSTFATFSNLFIICSASKVGNSSIIPTSVFGQKQRRNSASSSRSRWEADLSQKAAAVAMGYDYQMARSKSLGFAFVSCPAWAVCVRSHPADTFVWPCKQPGKTFPKPKTDTDWKL